MVECSERGVAIQPNHRLSQGEYVFSGNRYLPPVEFEEARHLAQQTLAEPAGVT